MRSARRRLGCFTLMLGIMLLAMTAFMLLERSVTPTLAAIATTKAEALAVETIYRAVQEEVLSGVEYSDLVQRDLDRDGRVAYMQPNLMEVNRVVTQVALVTQGALGRLSGVVFGVPLGQILGSQLFAVYGPQVKVGIIPIGTVRVSIEERFSEAGINQIRHALFLDTRARLQVVVPLYRREIEVTTSIPLTEAIVVGPVPATYVKIGNLGWPVPGTGPANPPGY